MICFLKNVNSGQLSRSSHSQKSSKGQTQGCQQSQSLLMPPPLPDFPLSNLQDAPQLQTCGRLSRGTKSSCHCFPLLPKRQTPLQCLGLVPQQRQGCTAAWRQGWCEQRAPSHSLPWLGTAHPTPKPSQGEEEPPAIGLPQTLGIPQLTRVFMRH